MITDVGNPERVSCREKAKTTSYLSQRRKGAKNSKKGISQPKVGACKRAAENAEETNLNPTESETHK
jgi:hypothetical protein